MLSAYNLFIREERPKYTGSSLSFQQIMKELAERWNSLGSVERDVYMKKMEEDRVQAREDHEKRLREKQLEQERDAGKERTVRKAKDGKPKRPRTDYQIFESIVKNELRAKRPNASDSDISKAVNIKWSKLTAEQKRYYHEEARREREAQEKAWQEWSSDKDNLRHKQLKKLEEKRKESVLTFIMGGGFEGFGQEGQDLGGEGENTEKEEEEEED